MAKESEHIESGEAENVWCRVINGAEDLLPKFHSAKAIFYDNLAQVRIVAGDHEGAKDALQKAYHITRVSAGYFASALPTDSAAKCTVGLGQAQV